MAATAAIPKPAEWDRGSDLQGKLAEFGDLATAIDLHTAGGSAAGKFILSTGMHRTGLEVGHDAPAEVIKGKVAPSATTDAKRQNPAPTLAFNAPST